MNNQKVCPKCGSPLALRTAQKGKFKGQKFYGCTNYPNCKYIENIASTTHPTSSMSTVDSETTDIPFILNARELYHDSSVTFYQTIGLQKKDLLKIRRSSHNDISHYASWRIDSSVHLSQYNRNDTITDIYKIALKILNRGKLTLNSEFIENEIEKLVKEDSNIEFRTLQMSDQYQKIFVDGHGFEKRFYYSILPKVFGQDYQKYCIPQTHISSIVRKDSDANPNQRVDFMLHYNDKKVIVEIDGNEHLQHSSKDSLRDDSIKANGFDVLRFTNKTISNSDDDIAEHLKKYFKVKNHDPGSIDFILNKILHQIEITLLHILIDSSFDGTKKMNICIPLDFFVNSHTKNRILSILETDLKNLLSNLFILYNLEIDFSNLSISSQTTDPKTDIFITFYQHQKEHYNYYEINDIYLPYHLSQQINATKLFYPTNTDLETIQFFLKYIFRFDEFREGQYEAIKRTLERKDSIVLLPTGAGKSIAFQLASLLLPGITIVVEPIISLIDDQIDNLCLMGIDRVVGITGQILNIKIKNEYIEAFGRGEYLFCYVAPERFQIESFRKIIITLSTSIPVSLIAIDEAHCVSEWGHDFRTSYLNIGKTCRSVCSYYGENPPVLALTGTASHSVLKDVQRELEITEFDAIITPKTFDRQELNFEVITVNTDKKKDAIKGLLTSKLPDFFHRSFSLLYTTANNSICGLLFCPHVNGSHGVVEICNWIQNSLDIPSAFYSGKAPSNRDTYHWMKQKKEIASQFKNNEVNLLVATKSFGMGIDKPNIGFTIHYGLPNSIESFYQEAGRSGRNRQSSLCTLVVSNEHKKENTHLLNPNTDVEEIMNYMNHKRSYDSDDDISRALFFHIKAFRGIDTENIIISNVLDEIFNNIDSKKMVTTFNNMTSNDLSKKTDIPVKEIQFERRNLIEKALHRLVVLGFLEDYTIDYGNDEFTLHISDINNEIILDKYLLYVSNYNKGVVKSEKNKLINYLSLPKRDFLQHATDILIRFIYQTVEKGRRRAFREMLSLAEESYGSQCNNVVRERILKYLETSYSDEIENIIDSPDEGLDNVIALFEGHIDSQTGNNIGGIRSPNDAKEIRGQVSRYLESLPDHPGLLFLRGLSESLIDNYEEDAIINNILAGINQSFLRDNISNEKLFPFLSWLLITIYHNRNEIYSQLFMEMRGMTNLEAFMDIFKENDEVTDEMLYEYFILSFLGIIKSSSPVYNLSRRNNE